MRSELDLSSHYQSYVQEVFGSDTTSYFQNAKEKAQSTAQILGKSAISISAAEGRMLYFFTSIFNCKNFVEIGTLTGYSALWILSGMKSGSFCTLEKDPAHAKIAREVLQEWKLDSKSSVDVRIIEGDARVSLKEIKNRGPFDGIFIDGNKCAYVDYLNWAEENLGPGSLILADNIFLGGSVWSGTSEKFSAKQISVMKEFNRRLANPEKYESMILPTTEGLFVARLK